MTAIIKPVTMILALQALHHMGRRQLSVGMVACFRFGAAYLDSLLTETAAHTAWSRLTGLLTPIDNGVPAAAQSLIVDDDYTHLPASDACDADPPHLLGTETLSLKSKRGNRPSLSVVLPGLRAQCVVEWVNERGAQSRKLDPQIESLRLSPRLGCGWILYRAVTPVADARIDDIVSVSAGWGVINQPTVRPGHRLLTGTDRRVLGRHRRAIEHEAASQQGLAGWTCAG